jgi:anti-sigma regulatory factor (Ser/Thr protein kinase)
MGAGPPSLFDGDSADVTGANVIDGAVTVLTVRAATSPDRLPLTEHLTLALPPEPDSPSLARDLVGRACRRWALMTLFYPARLVVSELITNAVEHAGSPITLGVLRRGACLHITVGDRDPRLPLLREMSPPEPGRPLDERGRGLHLVDAVAVDWGAMPTADGKIVWATIGPTALR